MPPSGDKRICEKGSDEGVWLPLGGDAEQDWPTALRIILYFIGLVWCFLGVAVIADVFMGSIEKITSRKVTKKSQEFKDRNMTVLVWNPTVANLTLMALGSSAPEILLNVIELFGQDFYSGKLGPSTIVGSAAFNFLCIVAVCVSAIDDGEIRVIKEVPVFAVTTSFSLFAYLWMVFVLLICSKNVVDVWEGVVSFLCFPLLVGIAYLADRGYFTTSKPLMGETYVAGVIMSKEELATLEANIRRVHGYNLSDEQVAKFVEHTTTPKSRAMYRVAATREMTGGRRISVPKLQTVRQSVSSTLLSPNRRSKVTPVLEEEEEEIKELENPDEAIVEFKVERYAVLENAGKVELTVERRGNLDISSAVKYRPREGTAKFETDFKLVEGTLVFEPSETEKVITVEIVDDNAYEEDEEFFVDLMDELKPAHSQVPWTPATLGAKLSATVIIIDDDLPGILNFPADSITVQENANDKVVEFVVERKHGGTGKVGCSYHTEDDTAIAGVDYDKAEGRLEFQEGQMSAVVSVNIKAAGKYERKEIFRLILSNSFGGAKFDPHSDGGSDSCILTVSIASHQSAKERIDRLMSKLTVNWDKAKLGHANWREQFIEALYVNGGNDDEDDPPGIIDRVMHVIMLPWKLMFAIVPPTDYCGGWACFICSLGMIGVVTAVIGDLAKLFGCCCDIPDEVTAITFVALGTSLPDTFASKTAAQQDPFADASIGNVTGSNSVNVFLGLGLPWMIGSAYWTVKSEEFRVPAGALVPSVIIYCICALCCVSILLVRRQVHGGELGGPQWSKWATSGVLVLLWCLYVTLSSIYTLKEKKD